jgi:hypothetical protein
MRSCIKKVVALVLPLLLHSLAVPTLTHENHNGERWIESDGQILPEPERLNDAEDLRYLEWVRGYGKTLLFSFALSSFRGDVGLVVVALNPRTAPC